MPREKYKCVYDIETYPNLTTFVFKDYEKNKRHEFIIFSDPYKPSDSINQIIPLIDFIEKRLSWAIGYNNIGFDDIILKQIYLESDHMRIADPSLITSQLKTLANGVINEQSQNSYYGLAQRMAKMTNTFKSMDLMLIFNPVDRVSLKQLAIGMKWHKIMENPLDHTSIITKEDIPIIMEYNRNDVDITELLLSQMSEEINNRIDYTIKFGTNVINEPNSTIGRRIILDNYCKESGVSENEIKKRKTNYAYLQLKDCISPKIFFITPEYKRVFEKVKESVINPNKEEVKAARNKIDPLTGKKVKSKPLFEAELKSKYLTHTMMLGGLHSNNPSEIMEETDIYSYWDLDVRGYYPRLIINDRLHPAHLDERFVDIFEEKIVEERMKVVDTDPVLSYMLKIAANATFGLTDTESWLKDPKMAKYITISGQLFLFMLMEWLEYYSNCVVVYSNTDGLTVRVPKNEISYFKTICSKWESYLNFELEFVEYRKIIMRDVNNYLIFTKSDDPKKNIKAKGAYLYSRPIHKGYVFPIVAKAVQLWYKQGISAETTILNCTDIFMFMKAERTSIDKFDVILDHADMNKGEIHLQKNNRWIITEGNPDEGRLYKVSKTTGSKEEMQSNYRVTPIPNIDTNRSIDEYCLNYNFYINEANDLINLTKPLNKDSHNSKVKQARLVFS